MGFGGWVKIWRKAKLNWLWQMKPFSPWHAFESLIIDAAHKAGVLDYQGEIFSVRRGQLVKTLRQMASDWGWSRTRVSAFIKKLLKEPQIDLEKSRGCFVITLLNYETYQGGENRKSRKKATKRSQKEPQKSHEQETKEVKKEPSLYPSGEDLRPLVAQLFQNADTAAAVVRLVAVHTASGAEPDKLREGVLRLHGLYEDLNREEGIQREPLFRYAIEETVNRNGKTIQYTEVVIQNAIREARDGKRKF